MISEFNLGVFLSVAVKGPPDNIMLFKYDYWYFTSGLPEKICDDIVKYALSQEEVEGVTGTGDKSKSNGIFIQTN